MNTLNQKNQTEAFTHGYQGAPKTINPSNKTAVIYQAGGSHYKELLELVVQHFLVAKIECPNIYVIEKADVSPLGTNELPAPADVVGSLTAYHRLQVPYAVLATKQANDELLAAVKNVRSMDLAMPEADYYLLFKRVGCHQTEHIFLAANTLVNKRSSLSAKSSSFACFVANIAYGTCKR